MRINCKILSLVLAGLALNLSVLHQAKAGAFRTISQMTTGHEAHTATLLPNGKVLIAGGGPYLPYPASSTELYDPVAGTWTVTGALNSIHFGHTATLLPNGKVLVVGGQGSNSIYLSGAELYDPATGVWTATGPLNTARTDHTATLLPNGKVLVAGGYVGNGAIASAELYDPATGTWTTTGSMTAPRYTHTATLLPNGKVLVAGGHNYQTTSASAELYDPAAGTWTTTGSMTSERGEHTATLLPSGKALIVGGARHGNGWVYVSSAELYDPITGMWTAAGAMANPRSGGTATLLPSGNVLIAGGHNSAGGSLSSAELYHPANGTWSATGSLTKAREVHTATLLPNGTVLVAGGYATDLGVAMNMAEMYDPAITAWTTTGSMTTPRYSHTATLLPNGQVLVAGGVNSGYLSSAEVYDPATGTWTATGLMTTTHYFHTATLLKNGKVLVADGNLPNAELYDPATGTWTATGSMSATATPTYHTATLLPNGKVLVAGSYFGGYGIGYLPCAELYDPANEIWTPTGAMNTARQDHTATLLPNGKVLVAGGHTPGNGAYQILSSAELYDPATGTWTTTGSMTTYRSGLTATLLPNGKVLAANGDPASADLYDPTTGTWTATNGIATFGTGTLLPNGKVLIAGEYPFVFSYVSTLYLPGAELFDAATGTWTTTGGPNTARSGHSATLLPNGKVLIAGGETSGGYVTLSSAELYDPSPLIYDSQDEPASQTVPAGANVSFSFLVFAANPVTYQWAANGTNLLGATNTTLTLTNVSLSNSGTYFSVLVSNSLGTVQSSNAILTVVPAVVTTGPASEIFATGGATLNGSLMPGPNETLAWIEWGTDTNYGDIIGVTNIDGVGGEVALSAALTGLSEGAIYHFRLVAWNDLGLVYGDDQIFVEGSIPTATTLGAVTSTNGATLNATVNPNGWDTTVYFKWGTSNGLLTNTTPAMDLGAGIAPLNASSFITSLAPFQQYYYQVVASNYLGNAHAPAVITFLSPPFTSAPLRMWASVAASADGSKLVAAANDSAGPSGATGGGVYISTDYGATWNSATNSNAYWQAVASSADGSTLIAAVGVGGLGSIYVSTNSGTTFNPAPSAGIRAWNSLAASADGSRLAAAAVNAALIYVSTNSGVSWVSHTGFSTPPGYVAASADGLRLIATANQGGQLWIYGIGPLYISTNGGVNWTNATNAPIADWNGVASSADGNQLLACSYPGNVFISTNEGVNWTKTSLPANNWNSVAESADGKEAVAVANSGSPTLGFGRGGIWTSTDSGVTWVSNNVPSAAWASAAMSADGNEFVATMGWPSSTGGIYVSQTTPAPVLKLPAADTTLISWMVPSLNFTLQQSPDLMNWTDVPTPPVMNLTNLQNQVSVSPTNGNNFYRLKH